MFSYRHAFHAGNHADVLKHAILVAILRHLALKDKAFWVFDTHAGAGRYRLDAASSSKNREHEGGVMALWREKALPALLADYRDEVARFDRRWRKPAAAWRGATGRDAAPVDAARAGRGAGRGRAAEGADRAEVLAGDELASTDLSAERQPGARPSGGGRPAAAGVGASAQEGAGWSPEAPLPLAYPGSPWLALQQMRPQDRLRCFEAHPTEVRVLQQALAPAGRQVQVFGEDGFEGLKALLPPVSRRGLVVIDPSYEDKRDYARARRTLIEALTRFATGTMLLWYPLVRRREAMLLMEHLAKLPGARDWLDVRLQVCSPPEDGHGLYGSGVFVINPPYTLAAALHEAMPVLHRLLAQDGTAGWWMQTSAEQAAATRAPGAARPVAGRAQPAGAPTKAAGRAAGEAAGRRMAAAGSRRPGRVRRPA